MVPFSCSFLYWQLLKEGLCPIENLGDVFFLKGLMGSFAQEYLPEVLRKVFPVVFHRSSQMLFIFSIQSLVAFFLY